jgi:hypothetical protein
MSPNFPRGHSLQETRGGPLSDEQLADYSPWFDNCRRLRELITELEEISLAVTEADPRWNR